MNCLDDSQLMRLAGGLMRPNEAEGVKVHLDTCVECRQLFAWAAEVCPVAGPLKRESRARVRKTPSK